MEDDRGRYYREATVALPASYTPGKIGVVTVTYRSNGVLPDFLDSVTRQTYRNFMLIVVDNQSNDGTIAQLRGFRGSECRIIANDKNVGVAAGNNQGIRVALEAGCEYVLLLNNDVVFAGTLFEELVEGLRTYGCQMITPKIYHHDRPDILWCAGGYFKRWLGYRCEHYGAGHTDKPRYSYARAVDYAPTCCVLMKREVFARVGLMDETYYVYVDDVDFMLRAKRLGVTTFYLPKATLFHKVSSLTGLRSPFTIRYTVRNWAYYHRKHVGRLWTIMMTIFSYVEFLVRLLVRNDSFEYSRLRYRSWNEGLRLYIKRLD